MNPDMTTAAAAAASAKTARTHNTFDNMSFHHRGHNSRIQRSTNNHIGLMNPDMTTPRPTLQGQP